MRSAASAGAPNEKSAPRGVRSSSDSPWGVESEVFVQTRRGTSGLTERTCTRRPGSLSSIFLLLARINPEMVSKFGGVNRLIVTRDHDHGPVDRWLTAQKFVRGNDSEETKAK